MPRVATFRISPGPRMSSRRLVDVGRLGGHFIRRLESLGALVFGRGCGSIQSNRMNHGQTGWIGRSRAGHAGGGFAASLAGCVGRPRSTPMEPRLGSSRDLRSTLVIAVVVGTALWAASLLAWDARANPPATPVAARQGASDESYRPGGTRSPGEAIPIGSSVVASTRRPMLWPEPVVVLVLLPGYVAAVLARRRLDPVGGAAPEPGQWDTSGHGRGDPPRTDRGEHATRGRRTVLRTRSAAGVKPLRWPSR